MLLSQALSKHPGDWFSNERRDELEGIFDGASVRRVFKPIFLSRDTALTDLTKIARKIASDSIEPDIIRLQLEKCWNFRPGFLKIQMNAGEKGLANDFKDEVLLIPAGDKPGDVGGVWVVIRQAQAKLEEVEVYRRLAHEDTVTGIWNRRGLLNAVDTHIEQACDCEDETQLAVFCIDLDEFKIINDLAGHAAGDEMLKRVARALTGVFGQDGMVGRLGGDEFGVVALVSDPAEARQMAFRINSALKRIRLPYVDRIFSIGASIGLTLVTLKHRKVNAADLFNHADAQCLISKRRRDGSVCIDTYDTDLAASPEVVWRTRNPSVSSAKRLEVQTCPILRLKPDADFENCFETIGWRLVFKGVSKALQSLGRREMKTSLLKVHSWALDAVSAASEATRDNTRYMVPVSSVCFGNSPYLAALKKRLDACPALASRLCLELVESDLLSEPVQGSKFLTSACEMGVQTAVRGFSGHWPLLDLITETKINWLCFDPDWARNIQGNARKRMLLQSIFDMLRVQGVHIMAQNVTSKDYADVVRTLPVDAYCGPYYGNEAILAHSTADRFFP